MRCLLLLLACSLLGCTSNTNRWRAVLESPGGELPFGLTLSDNSATMTNGPEVIEIAGYERTHDGILLPFAHYDAQIDASYVDGSRDRLEGWWVKTTSGSEPSRLRFRAERGRTDRFDLEPIVLGLVPSPLPRRWRIDFSSSDEPAVGIFETQQDNRTIHATIMTTTGDYRYLEGQWDAMQRRLRLSVFDGAHAFLFDAQEQSDGSLYGDFWSRDVWHETFVAHPDPKATLPDAFAQTAWVGDETLEDLVFTNLEGQPTSVASLRTGNQPVLLEVFGSWCPNCHDSARFVTELHEKYGDLGLCVIGLAFELTDDFDRSRRQVQRFMDRHDATYDVLIAGMANKAKATETLRVLDGVRSYPTMILIDGEGDVRAIHTGFTGPATGAAYAELRDRIIGLIEEMLASG